MNTSYVLCLVCEDNARSYLIKKQYFWQVFVMKQFYDLADQVVKKY